MEPVQNEKGEWVIPATRRPDGTWRKEQIVKAGYVPQDEIRAFATRANSAPKKGIPGMAPAAAAPQKPKQEKKKVTPAPSSATETVLKGVESMTIASTPSSSASTPASEPAKAPEPEPVDPAVAAAKKLKALKKKLREIEEIAAKKTEDLTPEQAEKLAKRAEVESEIAKLSV